MAPVVVDFVAATVAVHTPPGAPLNIDFTVPSAHDTGTWTATVYRSHKNTGGPPLTTAAVSSFTDRTATASFTDDAIDGLIPDGSWRFGGWWILARDTGDGPVPWAKGPFVIDPQIPPTPGGTTRSIVFTAPGTAAAVEGPIDLDAVVAAIIGGLVDAEAAARAMGDADLQAQLTAEVLARIAGNTGWQDLLDAETAARVAAVDAEALARDAGDVAEADARATADSSLQADITNEVVTRVLAVAAVQAAVDSEAATRAGDDDVLRTELTVEAAARAAADATEAAARVAGDTALGSDVTAEAAARAAGDATEAVGRAAGDDALQAGLTAETAARTSGDASEATSRAAADVALQAGIAAEAAARAAADIAEAVARAAGDATVQASVTDETTARQAADTSEAAARSSADTDLQTSIDVEAAARSAADTTEAADRAAGDATVQATVTAETAARQLAATTETAARVAGDAAVQAAVDGEVANRQADVGNEAAARAAGDLAASAAIAVEATSRAAEDAAEATTRQTADAAITAAITALDSATLKKSGNLSDLAEPGAARTNLAVHYVPVPVMQSGRWYRCPAAASLTTGTPTLGTVYAMPKFVAGPVLIDRIGCEVTGAGGAGSVVRLGVWEDDGTGRPAALVLDAGTVDGTDVDVHEITVSQPLPRGWYWFGAVAQVAAPVLRITAAPIEPVQLDLAGTPTAGQVAVAFADAGVSGALGSFAVDGVAPTGIAVHVRCGPVPGTEFLLEDGTSVLLLEDGTSHLLLED